MLVQLTLHQRKLGQELKRSRNLEAGAGAKSGAVLFIMAHLVFLRNAGLAVQGWYHPQQPGPSPTNHLLGKCPTARSYGSILFSIDVPFFHITLACVKLT